MCTACSTPREEKSGVMEREARERAVRVRLPPYLLGAAVLGQGLSLTLRRGRHTRSSMASRRPRLALQPPHEEEDAEEASMLQQQQTNERAGGRAR